jgi:hypothetical protein
MGDKNQGQESVAVPLIVLGSTFTTDVGLCLGFCVREMPVSNCFTLSTWSPFLILLQKFFLCLNRRLTNILPYIYFKGLISFIESYILVDSSFYDVCCLCVFLCGLHVSNIVNIVLLAINNWLSFPIICLDSVSLWFIKQMFGLLEHPLQIVYSELNWVLWCWCVSITWGKGSKPSSLRTAFFRVCPKCQVLS